MLYIPVYVNEHSIIRTFNCGQLTVQVLCAWKLAKQQVMVD